MQHFRWLAIVLLLSLLGFIVFGKPARAAEGTADEESSDVLNLTTQQYFAAVEKYRDDADKFRLAQQTYYQLNTLAAQDEAIRRAKDVMVSRAEMLNLYFTYLHLSTLQVRGAELSDKERTLNIIASNLAELAIYKDQVAAITTRAEANTGLTSFNARKDGYLSAAYSALEIIKIGQLQTAIDTASLLRRDMEGMINNASISAADRAIKLRGLQETDRLLQEAAAGLKKVLEQHRLFVSQGTVTEQNYRSFSSEVEPIFVQIRQAESFMKEIAKGL